MKKLPSGKQKEFAERLQAALQLLADEQFAKLSAPNATAIPLGYQAAPLLDADKARVAFLLHQLRFSEAKGSLKPLIDRHELKETFDQLMDLNDSAKVALESLKMELDKIEKIAGTLPVK